MYLREIHISNIRSLKKVDWHDRSSWPSTFRFVNQPDFLPFQAQLQEIRMSPLLCLAAHALRCGPAKGALGSWDSVG